MSDDTPKIESAQGTPAPLATPPWKSRLLRYEAKGTRKSSWKGLLAIVVLLSVIFAGVVAGYITWSDQQRTTNNATAARSAKQAGDHMKRAATNALLLVEGGKYVTADTPQQWADFARELYANDNKIGFVKLLGKPPYTGGGVYIDPAKSTPTSIYLSALIDAPGASEDQFFGVSVRASAAKRVQESASKTTP
jgi:type II secretory pathway pseudopilin PulG